MVYIIKVNENYKIGKTNNIEQRISNFKTAIVDEIEVVKLFECKNSFTLENLLHSAFKSKRIKGEWFSLNNIDLITAEAIYEDFVLGDF